MVSAVELAKRIIKEQELVIGPLAWREAKKVRGLSVSGEGDVSLSAEAKKVLGDLVKQYEALFGPASREVCREAVKNMLPQVAAKDIPDVLK